MKIKLRTFIIIWATLTVVLLWGITSLYHAKSIINLNGGEAAVKNKSMWEMYKYRDVNFMRKAPMKWCPYLAYRTIHEHVHIVVKQNKYWFVVNSNINNILMPEAKYNKKFAIKFKVKGNTINKIRTIYKYCRKTKYNSETYTYAKNVFKQRTGDCASISAAFYVLCKAKHIPVRYIIGYVGKDCHAWNKVKINKKWYYIDCTIGHFLKPKLSGRKILEIW